MDSPYGSNRWAFQVGAASIDRRVIAPLKSLVCEHEPSTLRGALPPRPVPSAAAHRRSADRWPDRTERTCRVAQATAPSTLHRIPFPPATSHRRSAIRWPDRRERAERRDGGVTSERDARQTRCMRNKLGLFRWAQLCESHTLWGSTPEKPRQRALGPALSIAPLPQPPQRTAGQLDRKCQDDRSGPRATSASPSPALSRAPSPSRFGAPPVRDPLAEASGTAGVDRHAK